MFSKRNSIFGLIILCGLLFSLSFPSIAATHYVSINGGSDSPYTNGWASAATNIQWALDVATNGEAVLVTNGTYNLADQIVITNGVILQSVNGKDFTFISGQYTTFRCILLSNDNAIVDGFTVTNGKTTANGGGVYIYGGTLRNCHVRNNNSGGNGAVIARFLGTVLTTRNVFNCIITSNSGKYAGGICLQGATASNCVVSYNSSSDRQNASPGGASLESLGYLYDSEISYNNGEVGGVKIAATAGMTGCKVVGNRGYTYGGVAYLYVSANLRNCLVINNHSLSNAGGVYIQPDAAALGIQNLTVVSNSTDSTNAGGIQCAATNIISLYNTIAYFNVSGGTYSNIYNSANSSNIVVRNCCFGMTNGALFPSTNINNVIYADPLLVDMFVTNCRLRANSPCVNAGYNENWMTNAVDLDGKQRVRYGTVDIGAHETIYEGAIYRLGF